MSSYTADQVSSALAALELNGGNIKRTAEELCMPLSTLRLWRDKCEFAVTKNPEGHPIDYDFARLWGDKQAKVLERVEALIPSASFRDLSIFAGIAADKHLDYSQGRKGGVSVNIDNRTVHIDTAEAIAALRAAKTELMTDGHTESD